MEVNFYDLELGMTTWEAPVITIPEVAKRWLEIPYTTYVWYWAYYWWTGNEGRIQILLEHDFKAECLPKADEQLLPETEIFTWIWLSAAICACGRSRAMKMHTFSLPSIIAILCYLVTTASFNFAPFSRHVSNMNNVQKLMMVQSDDAVDNNDWSSTNNPAAG